MLRLYLQIFIISMMVVGLGIPMLILIFLYGCIIKRLTDESRDLGRSRNMSISSQRQRRQVVVMLIAVVILFFISLLPFRVFSLWVVYASPEDITRLGLEGYLNLLCFARIMFYLNSAGNPALYNLFSSKFRCAFKQVLLGFSYKRSTTTEFVSMTTKYTAALYRPEKAYDL